MANIESASIRDAITNEIERLKKALTEDEIERARRGMMNCMEFDTGELAHLDLPELASILQNLRDAAW